jgi:thiol-disulfide isomerase/thioredoxin
MRSLLVLAIVLVGFICVSAQNEQAPLQEKELDYKNWKYKGVFDNKDVNLRQFTDSKKLVLVVYFAPWCHNWKHEAPFVQKMYEKYRSAGLDVIGVGEYGTIDEMKANLTEFKITFPTVYESNNSADREKTTHFNYRKALGDTRKWGSPFNIFLEPANLNKDGDVLTKKAFFAMGELIEPDAEKFIRQKLGLPAIETKADVSKKEIEACEGNKKIADFKKPE